MRACAATLTGKSIGSRAVLADFLDVADNLDRALATAACRDRRIPAC